MNAWRRTVVLYVILALAALAGCEGKDNLLDGRGLTYSITGKVKTPDGDPLEDMQVRVYKTGDTENYYSAITREDGSFSFHGIPEGEYDIHFASEDYYFTDAGLIDIVLDHDMLNMGILAKPSERSDRTVTGSLLFESGDASLSENLHAVAGDEVVAASSDFLGHFALPFPDPIPPDETITIVVDQPEGLIPVPPQRTYTMSDISGPVAYPIGFVPVSGYEFSGFVTDENAAGIEDMKLDLHNSTGHMLTAFSDGAGYFEFPTVPDGDYTLWLDEDAETVPGASGYAVSIVGSPVQEYDISVGGETSTYVTGLVVTEEGFVVPAVTIYLTGEDGSRRVAVTDEQGVYHIDNLVPGSAYTVSAALEGYEFAPEIQQFTAEQDGTVLDEFERIPNTYDIIGTVTDAASGEGIAGVTIILTTEEDEWRTTTDSDGDYIFADFPEAFYHIHPEPSDEFIFEPEDDIVPLHDGLARRDFVRTRRAGTGAAAVWGRVVYENGGAVVNIEVRLNTEQGPVFIAATDEEGVYAFADVEPGEHVVNVAWGTLEGYYFEDKYFIINYVDRPVQVPDFVAFTDE